MLSRLSSNLQLRRLVPVIAHAERYSALASQPEILERLALRGMLMQVTAGSLLGEWGAQAREMAEMLITRRMAHVIASDAHSARRRSPVLSGGLRRATQLVGEEAAQAMVTAVPSAILRDEEIAVPEPSRPGAGPGFPLDDRSSGHLAFRRKR